MANHVFKPPQTVVLCDLDDTLTNRGNVPHTIILQTLHSLGFSSATLEDLKASNGLTRIHTRYGLDEQTFWNRFNELDNRPGHLQQGLITLYSDASAFLDRLHDAGIPVHIITNTPPEKAKETIRYLGLDGRVTGYEAYNYPCKTPQPKPHPDLAYQALAALHFPLNKNGHRPKTCAHQSASPHIWIIGDEECDIDLAERLTSDLTRNRIDAVVHSIHVNRRGIPLHADYTTQGPHHLLFAATTIQHHTCPNHQLLHQTGQGQP